MLDSCIHCIHGIYTKGSMRVYACEGQADSQGQSHILHPEPSMLMPFECWESAVCQDNVRGFRIKRLSMMAKIASTTWISRMGSIIFLLI